MNFNSGCNISLFLKGKYTLMEKLLRLVLPSSAIILCLVVNHMRLHPDLQLQHCPSLVQNKNCLHLFGHGHDSYGQIEMKFLLQLFKGLASLMRKFESPSSTTFILAGYIC